MSHTIKAWIEAMRLRTLPVSVAGVFMGSAFALFAKSFKAWPACLCLAFAILCQIASNFANEYYDYKAGFDKPGRVGPRRGVTEGDIAPSAMKAATFLVLGLACAIGCSLIIWGGWWLIGVGLAIALGVVAYSTGPYPLSHHGWGEIAVIFFFGIIPVNFTFYLQTGIFDVITAAASVSVGLMGANVLIVNNYRDVEDDEAVGKRTLAVQWGRKSVSTLYLFNGFIAVALMVSVWMALPAAWWIVPALYLAFHTLIWLRILHVRGQALTPCLGMTAILMLIYSLCLFIAAACN